MDEQLVGHRPPGCFWVLQSCPGWVEAYVQALCELQWGGLGLTLATLAAQSFLHTRARIKWPLFLQPLSSWRTMGRISSCPMGTVQLHGWPATIRALLSLASPWCPSCWSRYAFLPYTLLVPSNSCSGWPRAGPPGAWRLMIENSKRQVP